MTDGGREGTTAPSNPSSVTRRPASPHGISMQDIELYHGDFEDVAKLAPSRLVVGIRRENLGRIARWSLLSLAKIAERSPMRRRL